MSSKKLYIKTYGCAMNEYDSTKMAELMQKHHHMSLTDSIEAADLILLNTCSVRDKAQEKVFSDLGRWRKYKKTKPNLVIGVGGCVASQEGATIIKRAPTVDFVFGPQTIHKISSLYSAALAGTKKQVDISFSPVEKFDSLPEPKSHSSSAYISIMEGCSKYCSFCVVPYTRGEEISRNLDSVLAEVAVLAKQGVQEITLLGQNVNDYRSTTHNGDSVDLGLLIQYIATLDEIKRIRFTTSHPVAFNDSLLEAYANEPKLVNHLHLPVQSGSDKILAAMKRGYTALEYKSLIRKVKQVRPSISISSDFIVGFPGETEADHQATLDLVDAIGFDQSYSFIYSRRPGTPAAYLEDNVDLLTKKQRLESLQEKILKYSNDISHKMIDTEQPVLVTGFSKKSKHELTGRTESNRIVNFPGDVGLIGSIVPIYITGALRSSLRGRLINSTVNVF